MDDGLLNAQSEGWSASQQPAKTPSAHSKRSFHFFSPGICLSAYILTARRRVCWRKDWAEGKLGDVFQDSRSNYLGTPALPTPDAHACSSLPSIPNPSTTC